MTTRTVYTQQEKVHWITTQDIIEDEWGEFTTDANILIDCVDKDDNKVQLLCRDLKLEVKWDANGEEEKNFNTIKLSFSMETAKQLLHEFDPTLTYEKYSIAEEDRYFVKKSFRRIRFSRKHGLPKWMVPFSFVMAVPTFGMTSIFLYKKNSWQESEFNVIESEWLVLPTTMLQYNKNTFQIQRRPGPKVKYVKYNESVQMPNYNGGYTTYNNKGIREIRDKAKKSHRNRYGLKDY